MGNMRKKIAFLAGAISFDNQNRVIDGVLRRAAEFDTDVFIFTCFVNYDESEENKVGAFQIMELPSFLCARIWRPLDAPISIAR